MYIVGWKHKQPKRIHICKKVGDRNRGRPEGSPFSIATTPR